MKYELMHHPTENAVSGFIEQVIKNTINPLTFHQASRDTCLLASSYASICWILTAMVIIAYELI